MLIAPGECADEELRDELMKDYDPQSAFEFELVDRLAGILWRVRRIPMLEVAVIDARHAEEWEHAPAEAWENNPKDESIDWKNSVRYGLLLGRDAAHGDDFGKLSRYKSSLMRALEKTLKLLSEAQVGSPEIIVASK
jgi:hypothetical protein